MNLADQDHLFLGLNMDIDPAALPQGWYSRGEHVELEGGVVGTRRGNICVPWADDWVLSRTYAGRPIRAHGSIIDAIRFANPSTGDESMVFVTGEGGFVAREGAAAVKLGFPTGYGTPVSGRLVQAFNEVFFLSAGRALRWRGDTAVGWEYLHFDPGALGGGFIGFPTAERGCYFNNRLYLKQDDNSVIVSDILAPERFSILNEFYVNAGDSDEIVAIVPYIGFRALVFKQNSIYALDNMTGDLSGAAINMVGSGIGTASDRSIKVVGQSILWLARQGVYRAAIEYEARLTPDLVPVSEPIKPIIKRINWTHAHKAVATVGGDRYYLAVPLDSSTANNALLVYNLRLGSWESVDEHEDFTLARKYQAGATFGDNFGAQALVTMQVIGRDKVVGFTREGCMFLSRYNTGKPDTAIEHTTNLAAWTAAGATVPTSAYNYLISHGVPFEMRLETRGYLAGDLSTKTGGHFEVTVSTHDPEFDINIVTTGPNETTEIKGGITRDRAKRLSFAQSGETGLPDTQTEALLEDYSIKLTSTLNGDTSTLFNEYYFADDEHDPVEVGREQEFQERFRIIKRFRAPRIGLVSRRGILRLKSVLIRQIQRFNAHRREV
jgi:hypothetical protein